MACLVDCSRFSSVRERCSNEEPSWINITAPQTISWKHYQNISLGVDSWINLGHLKFKILPWRVVVRVVILRDTNRQIDVRFRCFQHSLQLKSNVIETWPTFCIRMPSRQHHLISIIKKNSPWKITILYKFKYWSKHKRVQFQCYWKMRCVLWNSLFKNI